MDDTWTLLLFMAVGAAINLIGYRNGFLQGQRYEREDRQWRRWS